MAPVTRRAKAKAGGDPPATVQAAKEQAATLSAEQPEVIEVSSDPGSDSDSTEEVTIYMTPGDGKNGPSSSVGSKRKSSRAAGEDGQQQEEDDSPKSKRQRKLPVREKDGGGGGGGGHDDGIGGEATEKSRNVHISADFPSKRGGSFATPTGRASRHQGEAFVTETVTERGASAGKPVVSTSSSKHHIIFDEDDGPEEFYTPLEAKSVNPLDRIASKTEKLGMVDEEDEEKDVDMDDEGDEESDDDEAPEAVSIHQAADQSRRSARAVMKAAESQALAQKRKRQKRDDFFKQQAESRKTAQSALAPGGQASGSESEDGVLSAAKSEQSGHRRGGRLSVPDVLPAEFLESDESDDDSMAGDVARPPRKITFTTAEKKLAREGRVREDETAGSKIYRVLSSNSNPKLAPKAQAHSRNTKQQLLVRKRAPQKSVGFFSNKKRRLG